MPQTESAPQHVTAVSHIGLCVTDFERSLRFYTDGLGFEVAEGYDIPSAFAALAEVEPPIRCRSQMLVKGPIKLELLGWQVPQASGTGLERRNQVGFTHLSLFVDDLRSATDRLVDLGATELDHTHVMVPMPDGAQDVLFLADPDGIRIELIQILET